MARPAVRTSAVRTDSALAGYVPRGSECAYANLRMLARVAGTIYDDALRPVDLRAGQLALMWAILATEPVEIGELGRITLTDQTTLSRTIAKLRQARLVTVRPGEDRRVRMLSLSDTGRRRFAAAMPFWEEAQRNAAKLMPLADIRALARSVRRSARGAA